MKIEHCREKVVVFSIILVIGMAACSLDTNSGTNPGDAAGPTASAKASGETAISQPEPSTIPEIETSKPEPSTVPKPEDSQLEADKRKESDTTVPENNGNRYSDAEENSVGDPIIGIVDKFADNIIAIKDAGDPDLVYYFSTQNAQVVEDDSPIAVGDRVAITYRGVMGDEEHPGEAVKVMAESMMYQ